METAGVAVEAAVVVAAEAVVALAAVAVVATVEVVAAATVEVAAAVMEAVAVAVAATELLLAHPAAPLTVAVVTVHTKAFPSPFQEDQEAVL